MKYTILSFLLAFGLLQTSCNEKNPPSPEPPGSSSENGTIGIMFSNVVGDADLELHTGSYLNGLNQPFTITVLKYFVSNFEFIKEDGTIYTVPQDSCYFLIKESDPESQYFQLNIPKGTYTKLRFMFGVDSLRNTMPIDRRQGDLDPTEEAAGMYWTWNSGYIHFICEGSSDSANAELSPGKNLIFHVGGFGGMTTPTYNNTRVVELDITTFGTPTVSDGTSQTLQIHADLLKLFHGVNKINFGKTPVIMIEKDAARLADNIQQMFQLGGLIME